MAKRKDKVLGQPSYWQLLFLRLYFGTVGVLLPKIAAVTFLDVFCTPHRFSLKPPHRDLLARAKSFSFEMESIIENGKKITLQGYRWGKQGAIKRVLLIHGWRGKAADYYKLIPLLEAEGYLIETYDQPAHGASEGKRCSALDMERALSTYVALRGVPDAIIGHSLGAASTLLAFCGGNRTDLGTPPTHVVLLTNPVILENSFKLVYTLFGVPQITQKEVKTYVERAFKGSMDDVSLLNLGRPLPKHILAVYVPKDEEVALEDTLAFLNKYPEIKRLFVKTGDHARIMRHTEVLEATIPFLST